MIELAPDVRELLDEVDRDPTYIFGADNYKQRNGLKNSELVDLSISTDRNPAQEFTAGR